MPYLPREWLFALSFIVIYVILSLYLLSNRAEPEMEAINLNKNNYCVYDMIMDKYSWNGNYYHQLNCLTALLMRNPTCFIQNESKIELIFYPFTWSVSSFIHEIFNENQIILNNQKIQQTFDCYDKRYSLFTNGHTFYSIDSIGIQEKKNFFNVFTNYVKNKLNLSININKSNLNKIVILDRSNSRKIRNVNKLYNELQIKYFGKNKIHLIYNENLNYHNQLKVLTIDQPLYIITPHGANLLNLMYLNPKISHKTKIIEICPPYTHCKCNNNNDKYIFALCPYYYYLQLSVYLNLSYYAYAQQDKRLDCTKFCEFNKGGKEKQIRRFLRDVEYVNISSDFLLKIMDKIEQQTYYDDDDIEQHIFVEQVSLDNYTLYQYSGLMGKSRIIIWIYHHIISRFY